ncbi:hypothetical protein ACJMK2_000634 [Sinanodonta woodiana]|uniref:TIR domain-containing protein n=1 Tax=Sinanodonta woodiana TaxID=1069815 RepID=A0ABD3XTD5_SINWO
MAFEAISALAFVYGIVILTFTNVEDLTVFSCWFTFILLKRSSNAGHITMSFIGLYGVILSFRQSRQKQLDNTDAIIITSILHLLILYNNSIVLYVENKYRKIRRIYKNKSICMKLILIQVSVGMMVVSYTYFACYAIDILKAWIAYGPLNSEINFVITHGKPLGNSQRMKISNDDIASSRKIFFVGYHQSALYSNEYVYHNDTVLLPLKKELKEAYTGENVEFSCSIDLNLNPDVRLYSFSLFFTHNSIEVINSQRRKLYLPDEKIKNGSFYKFSLKLFDIRSEDFGIYRAGIRTILPYGDPFSIFSHTIYDRVLVSEDYVCVFNLSCVVDDYEYVDVPPGALLSFQNFYMQRMGDYLRVEHYVNGIPMNMMSNISFMCCLPSVIFIMKIWDQIPLNLPSLYMIDDKLMKYADARAYVCMCPSLYGIHRLKFYNDIYDVQRKIWITSEIWHPHITVVYPMSSNLPWRSISERETSLINKSKNERNFSIFEGAAFELLQSNMDDDLALTSYFEIGTMLTIVCIILCVTFASFMYFLKYTASLRAFMYKTLGLMLKVRPPDTGGNLANDIQIRDDSQTYNHDVFVLNVDDDRDFVICELHPAFEDRHLTVCYSEENLPSGPKIENIKLALANSNKVIVVVSSRFINYKLYNNFILPNIILDSLYKGLIAYGNLMLLVIDPCRVPECLIRNDRIVTFDFMRNSRVIFRRKLYEWLDSPVIRPGFAEEPVWHPDLLQLSQA